MKILGIGVDLVKIDRIQKILERSYKLRFLTKVLHPRELQRFNDITSEQYKAQFVASRWAAKQATVKALGRRQLVFAETHITKDINGKPFVSLNGETNNALVKDLNIREIHISMAHEDDLAVAYAIAMTSL